MYYSELKGLDAYTIAKKLGIDTQDQNRFIPKESGGEKYYDLICLQTSSGTITSDDINSNDNKNKAFKYSDELKIYYYVTNFFYWKQLPDFTGYQRVDMIPQQQLYRYNDKNKKKKVGKKSLERSSILDRNYYAIKGVHEVNDIVGQTIAAGKKYDESNPGDKILKIKVIGKVFDYEGKTAEEFIEELMSEDFYYYGIRTEYDEGINIDWKISKVTMHTLIWENNGMSEGDEQLDFVSGDDQRNVYFDIVVKEPTKETPSTSAPSNRSSGSYSAPTSGYDNSGSYSVPNSGYNGSGSNSSVNQSQRDFDGGSYAEPSSGSGGTADENGRGFEALATGSKSSTGEENRNSSDTDDFLEIIP